MACGGKDLKEAIQEVGCHSFDDVDEGDLDWHFENEELAPFLKEFCCCVKSGQLRNFPLEARKKRFLDLDSLLKDKQNCTAKLRAEIEERKIAIKYKEEYAALLKFKLKASQRQAVEIDKKLKKLREVMFKYEYELSRKKNDLQPIIMHICALAKHLADSRSKLQDILKLRYEDKGVTTLSIHPSLSKEHVTFLEKERNMLNQIETRVEALKSEKPQKSIELLQQWRSELTRLNLCLSNVVQQYNLLRGSECALHQQIKYLQDKPARMDAQNLDSRIEAAESKLRVLTVDVRKALQGFPEVADELVSKELAHLVLLNGNIKLQRLEKFHNIQEQVQSQLERQQARLSLETLCVKFEEQKKMEQYLVCKRASDFLDQQQALWGDRTEVLTKLIAERIPLEETLVPENDVIMETIGEILGSDEDELFKSFQAIVIAAEKLNTEHLQRQAILHENEDKVLTFINHLEVLVELFFNIQKPLTEESGFHGDLKLNKALKSLRQSYNDYAKGILSAQKIFTDKLKILDACPKEVFERNKRIHDILDKESQL